MNTTVAAVRAAIASAIDVEGLRVYPDPPAVPTPPCVIVKWPTSVDFDVRLGGQSELSLELALLVPHTDTSKALADMDTYLFGEFRNQINNATGPWQAIHVEGAGPYTPTQLDQAHAIQTDITVRLIA